MANSKLRGALIGYGWIARHGHVPHYQATDEVTLVAVADPVLACRTQAAHDFPGIRCYNDAASLLAAEKDLDFVDICTPPCWHAEYAIAALEQGLHVLCEKPLATSTAQATAMLQAAEKAGKVLLPCHTYKHAPVVRAVRKLLDEDRIGKVHLVTLQTFRNTHAKGIPDWNTDWRREFRYSGGGIAMDHGSHTFYLAFDWLGALPTSVTAQMTAQGNWDTEDAYSCTATFPNGGLAMAQLTWTAGIRRVYYTIHGERGAITVQDDDVELCIKGEALAGGNGTVTWSYEKIACPSDWMDASHCGWFGSLFAKFQATIASGQAVSSELEQAWTCVHLIESSYKSAQASSLAQPLAPVAQVRGAVAGGR